MWKKDLIFFFAICIFFIWCDYSWFFFHVLEFNVFSKLDASYWMIVFSISGFICVFFSCVYKPFFLHANWLPDNFNFLCVNYLFFFSFHERKIIISFHCMMNTYKLFSSSLWPWHFGIKNLKYKTHSWGWVLIYAFDVDLITQFLNEQWRCI